MSALKFEILGHKTLKKNFQSFMKWGFWLLHLRFLTLFFSWRKFEITFSLFVFVSMSDNDDGIITNCVLYIRYLSVIFAYEWKFC